MQKVLPDISYFRLVWLIILLTTALITIFPIQSEDVFMYLALGRRMLENGGFPSTDPFLIPGHGLNFHILHEWGSYILFYSAYFLGGFAGVILFKTFLIMLIFSVPTYLIFKTAKKSLFLIVVVILTIIASSHRFIARASLISDLFTVLTIAILMTSSFRSTRLIWVLPLIFLFWTNLHPGYHPSLLLLGIYSMQIALKGERKEIALSILLVLLSLAAGLLNPLGLEGFLYPLRTVLDERWNIFRATNYEWISTLNPMFLRTWEAKSLILLYALTLPLCWKDIRRRDWLSASVWLLSVGLGLSASRFMATSAYSVLTWFACRQKSESPVTNESRGVGVLALGCAIAGFLSILTWGYSGAAGHRRVGFGIDPKFFPIQAVRNIPEDGKNVFNEFGWGSYLSWLWDGRHRIFYHGHIDDPNFLLDHYLAVGRNHDQFLKTVNEAQIEYFLLSPKKLRTYPPPKLWEYLNTPPWKLIFEDETAMVFKKADTIPVPDFNPAAGD